MANGALPMMADSDIADTLAAGSVRSFDPGGYVSGDDPFDPSTAPPAVPVSAPVETKKRDEDEGWTDVPTPAAAKPEPKEGDTVDLPLPRRPPIREPQVPRTAPAPTPEDPTREVSGAPPLEPNPQDIAEGRKPGPTDENDGWTDVPADHSLGTQAKTFGKEFAKGVPAAISSMPAMSVGAGVGEVAGSAIGGALGTLVMPGPGTAAGTVIGGTLGAAGVGALAAGMQAMGTRSVTDYLMEKMGIINRAADEQAAAENPNAAMAGNIASGFVGMSPRLPGATLGQQVSQRALMGAGQASINVGQQTAEGRTVDPVEAGIAGAAGAAFPSMGRRIQRFNREMTGEGLHDYGEQFGPGEYQGPPEMQGPQQPTDPNFQQRGPGGVANDNNTITPAEGPAQSPQQGMPGNVGVQVNYGNRPNPLDTTMGPAANTNTEGPVSAVGRTNTPGRYPVPAPTMAQDNAPRPPSGGPEMPPPGQGSPGGGPTEASIAGYSPSEYAPKPWRPDGNTTDGTQVPQTDQLNTPVPGGYTPSEYSPQPWTPTPGARAENTAPPPNDGLTEKSRAIIAKSKADAAVSEPVKVGIGTAQVQPPPPKGIAPDIHGFTTFADRNEPGNESGRKYAKSNTATTNDNPATMSVDDGTGFTPDVTAAIKATRPGFNANDNATTPGKPGQRSPGRNEIARNEPGNQPGNQYGFDINKPANENTPAPPQGPHLPPMRSEAPFEWPSAEPTPGDHAEAARDARVAREEGGGEPVNWSQLEAEDRRSKMRAVPETKSAGEAPAGHEMARTEGQEEHPAVTDRAARGRLWQTAMQELASRGREDTIRALEESPAGDEHVAKLFEGLQEIDAQERAQAEAAARDANKPRNDLGKQTGDVTKARASNFKMNLADQVMEHYKHDSTQMPVTKDEKAAALGKLNDALTTYAREMQKAGQKPALPTKGAMSGGMRWLKAAKALLRSRDPSIGRLHEFLQDEFFHRHPELKELSAETARIESEAKNKRGSGDVAERAGTEQNPHELMEERQHRQLQDNLQKAERKNHPEMTGRGRYNTDRAKAERLADIDHSKMGTPKQRADAKALLDGPPKLLDKFKQFVKDDGPGTEGSLHIDKINDEFMKGATWLTKVWHTNFGNEMLTNPIAPHRQGKMGSDERQLALISGNALVHKLAREHQEVLHAMKLTDDHYHTFAAVDKNWNPTKMSRAEYVAARNDEFIRRYETGQEQETPALQAAADFWKNISKGAYDLEADSGSRAYYRENYISHMLESPQEYQRFSDYMTKKYGPSWFTKPRAFDTLDEAVAAGFKRKTGFDNTAEVMSQRLIAGASMRAKLDTLRDWENYGSAYHVDAEEPIATKVNGWEEVIAPNNDHYMIAPEVQAMWHNVQDREKSLWLMKGPMGHVFRAWMNLKAITVPTVLAWSGFHLQHVAYLHSTAGAAMGSAFNGEKTDAGLPKDWKGVAGGLRGRVRNTAQVLGYLAPSASKNLVEPILNFVKRNTGTDKLDPVIHGFEKLSSTAEGQRIMDAYNDPMYKRNAEEELHNQYMLEAGLSAAPHQAANLRAARGLSAAFGVRNWSKVGAKAAMMTSHLDPVQRMTFGTIQAWKQAQFKNAVADLFHQHPEYVNSELLRRAALREIGKNLDDLYGEALNSTKLYNKIFEGVGRGALLSMDWQGSQISQEGGAVTNTLRSVLSGAGVVAKRGLIEQAIFNASPKATSMTKYMGGVLGMSGLMSYMMTGEYPEGLDWVYPRIGGTNDDGTPKRVTLPHWHREWVMAYKHYKQTDGGLQGAMGAAGELLWSKMILAPYVHQLNNADFFNRQVYDPNADILHQIGQRAMSYGREMQPMTFENNAKIDAQGGGAFEKALSYAGMPPAPKYIERSDMQNRITKDFYTHVSSETKLYVNREKDEDKNNLYHKFDAARRRNDFAAQNAIKKEIVAKGYSKAENVGKYPANSGDQYMFSRLPRVLQIKHVQNMEQSEYKRYVLDNARIAKGDSVFRELAKAWKERP